jgi:hypothetical protein
MNVLEHPEPHETNPSGVPFSGLSSKTIGAADFPPPPSFQPLRDTAARQAMFGKFEYQQAPQPGNSEPIQILGDWVAQNITLVELPQVAGLQTYSGTMNGRVRFHRQAAPQLQALWKAWEEASLLSRVAFWGGSFVPRLIRGTSSGRSAADSLSVHTFGAAFDINVNENRLGARPALVGQPGSVRELVELANTYGFYWGGHFTGRPDGMHFEIAKWVPVGDPVQAGNDGRLPT